MRTNHTHHQTPHRTEPECCANADENNADGQEHAHHMNARGDGSCHSGASGLDHGASAHYLRKFWIVTALLIPLVLTTQTAQNVLGISIPYANLIGPAIATAVAYHALIFFQHAWHEIRSRAYGMMTLVALALGAGYLFSIAATLSAALDTQFYVEISTLVWVLLFGHYLEARSSASAGDALAEVAKLLPKKAHRLVSGAEEDVEVTELAEGDMVLVKPGEKVPADGVIVDGSAHIDEALISGESKPVRKKSGDAVVAGAICVDGSLTVRLTRVGENSTVGQIQKLISRAKSTKPRSQRIADRAARVLTAAAGLTALGTLLIWFVIIGKPFAFAATLAITVLVIACPHALGIAIPAVTSIATTVASRNGIFIKDLSKIETIPDIGTVMFDKTGTLTEGRFAVEHIAPARSSEDEVLTLTAALERHSSHIIGAAIVAEAQARGIAIPDAEHITNHPGMGISGTIDGIRYGAGNARLLRLFSINERTKTTETDATTVYLMREGELLGTITLADAVRPSAHDTVRALHRMGIRVVMITGDNDAVAQRVARELSIDTYFANVLPEDKYTRVRQLQETGERVMMVGDGVNDAPALTQADVGVAIGAGTDVAVQAGDIILTRNDPRDVVRLIHLAQAVRRKMHQNLAWALGYNIIAIPAAAGAFAPWGIMLRPEIGALLMSLSTVIVAINALTLRNVSLK